MAKSLFAGLIRADGDENLGFNAEDFYFDEEGGDDTPPAADDKNPPNPKGDNTGAGDDDNQNPGDQGGQDDGQDDGQGDDDSGDEGDDDNDNPVANPEIKAFHDILAEKGFIDPIENFDGNEELLEEQLESLPERYFLQAVDEVPDNFQNLLRYVFLNGENAKMEDVRQFFNEVIDPSNNLKSIDIHDEAQAYEYLESKFKGTKLFSTPEKLKKYLDGLVEDDSLVATAESHYNEDLGELEARTKKSLEDAAVAKKERIEKGKAFSAKVVQELGSLQWDKKLKEKVLVNLRPDVMQTIHAEIFKHPGALLQLSAFLTHFDAASGKFDLSTFAKQANTKVVEEDRKKIQKGSISSHLKPKSPRQNGGRTLMGSLTPIN